MLTPWEIKRKEMMPPLLMVRMNLSGVFFLLKVVLKNLGTFRQLRGQNTDLVHVRPKPEYEIPSYAPGMQCCSSDEKYLRPTLYCDCRAPEIVAMAHALGAYQKSDRGFAEAAFEFAKRKVILEIMPMDGVVPTLKRGTGTCLHKISLFVALCRAAGIPARYKFFALTILDEWAMPAMEHAPLMQEWYDAMGMFLLHGEGEVLVDGEWVTADAGAEPQRQASAWMPVTKLGEDSAGLWLFPIPGTTFVRESIPLGLGLPSRLLMNHLVPKQVVGVNVGILGQIEAGRKRIKEMGGEAVYDAEARKRRQQAAPKGELLRNHEKIVFQEP
ncbi:MAG TPA: transglutaminase family protein [Candidatus Thermoplasmatota archaeon]|nr:transglutaminase family protein [Candidatus Thermoplasmatota archaeon]